MTNRNSEPGAPTANTFRVVQIKTTARETHVVVRNASGRKLFDMWVPGVSIAVAVPADATIQIEPSPARSQTAKGKHK